jgi:tungstate transport system substrate-binding protein
VHVLARRTAQVLQTATHDDADLILVHEPEAERKFIAAGDGNDRRQIAWNDFVVVGPRSDPTNIGSPDAVGASFPTPAPLFVSRRDRSGTDVRERRLWREAGIDPSEGSWHCDIGGAALFSSRAVIVKKASFKSS